MTPSAWRADPLAFIADVLVNPETGRPFELYPAEAEFLRRGLTPLPDGRLPYIELVFAAPKKSGKTALAAMATLYVTVVLGGPFAEGYVVANDLEQSISRIFQAATRMIEASPLLRDQAIITATKVEFPSTGSTITALASDYAGAAGANPTISCFDELWAYTSERSRRLWDEMVPGVPTRKVSVRLTTTYAGFSGESTLLEGLHRRGLEGVEVAPSLHAQPGMLMAWHTEPVAPWQTPSWVEQMRATLRPSAFLRMIRNAFATAEATFVESSWWAACEDPEGRPLLTEPRLPVWVGVDASVRRDSTAIVACSWEDGGKVRLVWHRVWTPTAQSPIDFEVVVKATLRDLCRRFAVQAIRFDPYQLVAVSQQLQAEGLPMVEVPQTVPNLTEASSNLFDLIKSAALRVYPDAGLRQAIAHCVAVETPRGWRIAKEKAAHKIDVVVALALAALGTVRDATAGDFEILSANVAPEPRGRLLDRDEFRLLQRYE